MQTSLFSSGSSSPLSVAQLVEKIQEVLQFHFDEVYVEGEISNFKAYPSGHFYFTLKDSQAEIAAVMFRGQNRFLKFQPEDGMAIFVRGRVGVFEQRGRMQLLVDSMEPQGLGALQLAFEQLKKKLEKEGLFSPERKKTFPFFPKTLGIVTSPQGAALHDMIHVLRRRHPGINVLFWPVKVQGEGAAKEIAEAVEKLNQQGECELILVGRGGGSWEDLWCFNEEVVVRAVANSRIPIISCVGHETDFTLCDLAADLRAPTPSAAAELAVPVLAELQARLQNQQILLRKNLERLLQNKSHSLKFLSLHLKHPQRRLEEFRFRLDDLQSRIFKAAEDKASATRHALALQIARLNALSPLAILQRGYSIVSQSRSPQGLGSPLKSSEQVSPGDKIYVQLLQGKLEAKVLQTHPNSPDSFKTSKET